MVKKTNEFKERVKEIFTFVASECPPFPKNMLVELTNACNNKCVFCGNKKMRRNISQIDDHFLFRILKEAHELGVKEVGFYTTGEPLLSKRLPEYISLAKEIGYKYVYITTNGILATPEKIVPVIEAGLDSVKFSINAASEHKYKELHGTDNFLKVLDNLRFTAEYKRKHNKALKIYASYVVVKQNQEDKDKFKELVSSFVDHIQFSILTSLGGMAANTYKDMTVEGSGQEKPIKAPCRMLFNRFHVTCEGYLTICCVDFENYLAVADLNQVALKEAWNNADFVNIRKRHIRNQLEGTLCYDCIHNKCTNPVPLVAKLASM